jgi:signal transduction histidine kinase
VESELAGLLFLDSFSRRDAFSEDDVRRVATIREHINSAFAKALALQRLRQQRKQLQESYTYLGVLSDIAREITATLDLEAVLRLLYEHVHRLMDTTIFAVGLTMPRQNAVRFEFIMREGVQLEPFDVAISEVEKGTAWSMESMKSMENQSVMGNNDAEQDVQYQILPTHVVHPQGASDGGTVLSANRPMSFVYVPLLAQENLIGVIVVQSFRKNAYTEYQRNILRAIASNAVSALVNAESYTEIRRQQRILEDQAAEIELINTQLAEQQIRQSRAISMLEHSERMLEKQAFEVEQANKILNEKNLQLEQLNAEKNELMGIVAHDLKNPLASLAMSIEMLQRYADKMSDRDKQQRLESIRVIVARMSDIVNHLLDINALETGSLRYILLPTDVTRLVENVVAEYRERATLKTISLQYDAPANPCVIITDATLLHEVVENLISNAVKYSPQGKQVFVRVKSSAEVVFVEVQDEGPGISAEDQKKLFGKFSRLSARPTGGEHSTGLGLSIVKKLVEAMNGRVWCESEVGKGATFIVELPRASDEQQRV